MTAGSLGQLGYAQQLWALRYFWFSLVVNDIRSRYRRSIVGVGWSLLRPLGMTVIFCLVFGSMFNRNINDYAPYVLVSVTIWQFIAESMVSGCQCFKTGSAYIRQQRIPHAIFPLRTVLGSGFHFVIALSLGIALTMYLKGIANVPVLLFLPVALLILFVAGWSLAIVAGVAQTYFPDTSHLLEIGIQILFYLTPVMYQTSDFPNRHKFLAALTYNPIQSLLELIRRPLLQGELPSEFNLAMSLGFTAALAAIAVVLLRRLERNLVFWL